MRLFVALEIPAAVRENLAALMRELRTLQPQARWVRAVNLHVTLKFIGEMPPVKLESAQAALSAVSGEGPLSLAFRELGFFPGGKRPRVLWVGIAAGPKESALARLAGEIESRLEPLGVPREQRAFVPHLTLARFPQPGNFEKLRVTACERAGQSFGEFTAREFCLFRSELRAAGAQHTRLASFPLRAAEA